MNPSKDDGNSNDNRRKEDMPHPSDRRQSMDNNDDDDRNIHEGLSSLLQQQESLARLSNFSDMQNGRLNLVNFFQQPSPSSYNFGPILVHGGLLQGGQMNADPRRMNLYAPENMHDYRFRPNENCYYQVKIHDHTVQQPFHAVPLEQHKSPIAMLQEEHEKRKNQEMHDERTRTFHEFLFSDQNDLGARKKSRSCGDGSEEGGTGSSMSLPTNTSMDQSSTVIIENKKKFNSISDGFSKGKKNDSLHETMGDHNHHDMESSSSSESRQSSSSSMVDKSSRRNLFDSDEMRLASDKHKDDHRATADGEDDDDDDVPCVQPESFSIIKSPHEQLLEDVLEKEMSKSRTDNVPRRGGDTEKNESLNNLIEVTLKNPTITTQKTTYCDRISLLTEAIETKEHRKSHDFSTVENDAEMTALKKSKTKKVDSTDAILSMLPALPCEPEYQMSENCNQEWNNCIPSVTRLPDRSAPYLPSSREEDNIIESSQIDNWFPCKTATIGQHESSTLDEKVTHTSSREKLCCTVEPGVIEKLPHCKIHEKMYKEQQEKAAYEPLFCFQVTEMYCNSMILCCSLCSTWRHAECGGHYTYRSPRKCEENFKPICERCHEEKDVLKKHVHVNKFLARQRDIHLRKTLISNDLMRHASYSKHGLACKWPLGSVMPGHIGGHCKSVQVRNERTEKQWAEMHQRLQMRVATSKKQRLKDLQFILNRLEEAEGKTDLHNMILFLERDEKRQHPIGFERPQFHFFDPGEDHSRLDFLNENNAYGLSIIGEEKSDSESPASEHEDICKSQQDTKTCNGQNDLVLGRYKPSNMTRKSKAMKHCTRSGCNRKPRFDSAFCSDACGVHVMQQDLLRSLDFVNGMHPSRLHS